MEFYHQREITDRAQKCSPFCRGIVRKTKTNVMFKGMFNVGIGSGWRN